MDYDEREPRDPLAAENVMERWERQRPQPEPPRRQRPPSAAELEQMRSRDWVHFVDGRIAKALTERDLIRIEATAQFVAEVRNQLREEFAVEVGRLRGELAVQRTYNAYGNDCEVIDLPKLPLRNRDAA